MNINDENHPDPYEALSTDPDTRKGMCFDTSVSVDPGTGGNDFRSTVEFNNHTGAGVTISASYSDDLDEVTTEINVVGEWETSNLIRHLRWAADRLEEKLKEAGDYYPYMG